MSKTVPLQVQVQVQVHTMPQTLWVHKKPYNERTNERTNGSHRSVPFSHVDPQFATPRELFPSHPNPVYPHLHQLLPQRTPPEYHCAKPSGTTRVKTTIKAKIKIKITRGFTFFQVIRRANKRAGNSIEVNGKREKEIIFRGATKEFAVRDSTCEALERVLSRDTGLTGKEGWKSVFVSHQLHNKPWVGCVFFPPFSFLFFS